MAYVYYYGLWCTIASVACTHLHMQTMNISSVCVFVVSHPLQFTSDAFITSTNVTIEMSSRTPNTCLINYSAFAITSFGSVLHEFKCIRAAAGGAVAARGTFVKKCKSHSSDYRHSLVLTTLQFSCLVVVASGDGSTQFSSSFILVRVYWIRLI